MKHLALRLSLFFFTLSLFPCTLAFGDNSQLLDEVMAIHDEAMAKMTYMHEIRLQLQEIEKTQGKSDAITTAIENLKSAHKGMMQWMRAYKAPKTPLELQAAEQYLLQEKKNMQTVSEAINASIAESEKILQQ